MGGLLNLRGGTEFRFRGGGEEGGARFSISAAGGEGGCQLGWRAHAGLKPASRRCERDFFLRSLALALNFLVRRARIACHRRPWSYPRRGTAGAPQRMSSRHIHFRNSLTKWPSCQIWQYSGRWERGGVDFRFRRRAETPLPDCGLPRRMRGPPSPIAMCAEGRISFSRPPTVQNDAGINT